MSASDSEASKIASDRRALTSLLEMLSLQVYAPQLVARDGSSTAPTPNKEQQTSGEETDATAKSAASGQGGGFNSIEELMAAPERWKRVITKRHHRDILEGYLSVRASKPNPSADQEAAERRFTSFQTIKAVLKDLRELQLEKARLDQEQHKLLLSSSKKGSSAATKSDSDAADPTAARDRIQDEIIDVITRIDSAKERLEMAQEMLGFSTSIHSTVKPPRNKKASSNSATASAGLNARPRAPMKNARPDTAHTDSEGAVPASPSKATDAAAPRSPLKPAQQPEQHSRPTSAATHRDDEEARPEVRRTVRVGDTQSHVKTASNTWSHVDFGEKAGTSTPATGIGGSKDPFLHSSFYSEDDLGREGAPCANGVGHGWDRNFPTTRVAHLERVRLQTDLARKSFMRHATRRREEQLDADIAAALATAKDKIAVPFRGNGPLLSKPPPPPPPLEDLRPKTAGRPQSAATFRPKTASTVRRQQPSVAKQAPTDDASTVAQGALRKAQLAKEKFERERDIMLFGVRTDTVTLGMDLPQAHGAQMKCGALLRTAVEAARRNAEASAAQRR